jgi:hypothetical protein
LIALSPKPPYCPYAPADVSTPLGLQARLHTVLVDG